MGQTLVVYAVAALLLVAGSGPTLRAVRDASLDEFEDLGAWRTLDEFPFLQQVRPYLPPLVVDWIIVQRDRPHDLPAEVDHRFDRDGRVILVWPDGCEESESDWRDGSTCDPSGGSDCDTDPNGPDCDPCAGPDAASCPPPDCPAGTIVHPDWPDGDPPCVPDPECEEPLEEERPAQCPPPPEPRDEPCPAGTLEAYDGSCVPRGTSKLVHFVFTGTTESRTRAIELKVPYENLSVMIRVQGTPGPGYTVQLADASGHRVCFERAGGDDGDGCDPNRTAARSLGTTERRYDDTAEGPIPAANLTFHVAFEKSAGPQRNTLEVRLYGQPHEVPDGEAEET